VSKVPKEYRSAAPIVLFATAGMRLLQKDEQRSIIDKVCAEFKDSDFLFKSCKGQVRVISGEEEGIFGWLAVNYMTKSFTGEPVSTKNSIERSSTFGFLDMGGASAQLAFEPDREVQEKHLNDLTSVVLNSADSRSYRFCSS
jgi:Golgi nucleoside diphosphatase